VPSPEPSPGDGAQGFVTGRRQAPLERVATEINRAGGAARVGRVDALDEAAIERHLDQVVEEAGRVDISFNAVGFDEVQGVLLVDLSLKDFASPIANWSQTVF
jgi:3-oxoacyl-[acyl-carrier protein] reductase